MTGDTFRVKPAVTYVQVFGHVVLHHRKARKRTQGDVATSLRLSQGAYSRLERGQAVLSLVQLRQLAAVFDVSLAHLAGHADGLAALLKRKGVTVLDESPLSVANDDWLWVAPEVLVSAAEAVVLQAKHATARARHALRATQEAHVHGQLRRS